MQAKIDIPGVISPLNPFTTRVQMVLLMAELMFFVSIEIK
jgi:hypothetical protein